MNSLPFSEKLLFKRALLRPAKPSSKLLDVYKLTILKEARILLDGIVISSSLRRKYVVSRTKDGVEEANLHKILLKNIEA